GEKKKKNLFVMKIVYSGDIEWVPQPGQIDRMKELEISIPEMKLEDTDGPKSTEWWTAMAKAIPMVHDDIIVAKLRPGQTIECWMKAKRGVGKTHSKWSPVGTAFYRLLPEIVIDDELLTNNDALYLKNVCPMNVFDIEDIAKNGHGLKVSRPRDCTMCRECISKAEMKDKIKLRRKRNHFIVKELLPEAIAVLQDKCKDLHDEVDKMLARERHPKEEEEEENDDMEDID
ncbi:DNA-directed RNA polymerase, partial [Reticulomyxa filosa]